MPTLKQVTCHIEWATTNIPFEEYGVVYGDGIVESYIAVPHKPQRFSIHLTSSGYIAEGLAMIVYIDGQYQCNRNRVNLTPPKPGQPRNRSDVDFRVRQKEQTIGDGTFIGKDWRFDAHTIVPMGVVPVNFDSSHFGKLGEIEILVLRCRARRDIENGSASSDSGTHVSFDPTGEKMNKESVTNGKNKKGGKHQAFASNDDDENTAHVPGSFDGANERPHQLGLDGEAPPGGYWSWSYIPAYQTSDSTPASRPQKRVHFDYGPAAQQYQPRGSAPPENYRPPSGYWVDSETVAQEPYRKASRDDSGQNRSTQFSSNQYWNTPAGAIPYPPVPPSVQPPCPWQAPSQGASIPSAWAPPSAISSTIPSWHTQIPQYVSVPTYPSVPFAPPPYYPPNSYQVQFPSYITPFPVPAPEATAMQEMKSRVSGANDSAKNDNNENNNTNDTNNVSSWDTDNNNTGNSNNMNKGNSGNNDWTSGNDNDNNNTVNGQYSQTSTWNGPSDNKQNQQNEQANASGFQAPAPGVPIGTSGNWEQPNNSVPPQPIVPQAQHGQPPQNNTTSDQHGGFDGYGSQYASTDNPRRLYGPHGPYYSMQLGAQKDTSLAIEQEMPPYDVPESVAAQLGTTQQVQPGKGYLYLHKRTSPVYLDNISNPYARFVFKYRTKEQVEEQTGVRIETEPSGNEEVRNLQAFSQDELIRMLLRAQDALGGKIPDPPPQPATSGANDMTNEYVPTAVPAPNLTHLRYELPQRPPGPRNTGLGISNGWPQSQPFAPTTQEDPQTNTVQPNPATGGIVWGGRGAMNAQGEVTWERQPQQQQPDQQWQAAQHLQQAPSFQFHQPQPSAPQQPYQPTAFQGVPIDSAEFGPPPPSPGGHAHTRGPSSPMSNRGGWQGEKPGPDPNVNPNTGAWSGLQSGPGPAMVNAPASMNGKGNTREGQAPMNGW